MFFKTLIELANLESIDFIWRYKPPSISLDAQKFTMTGFGVEIAVKNTEYKVSDDRDVNSEESGNSSNSEEEDDLFLDMPPNIKKLSKSEIESKKYYFILSRDFTTNCVVCFGFQNSF